MSGVSSRLRPAKVRSALRRRWFERRLGSLPLAPGLPVVSLGTAYGGWMIPDGVLRDGAVCYCVGAGADISFDLELIARYGAVVRAIDPVARYEELALERAADEPNFSFRRAALAAVDGPLRMQVHHQTGSESVSAAGLYDSDSWVAADGLTLPSLMQEFGDAHIDLLKLDVEGAEYELLPQIDLRGLGVRIFATQLHHVQGVRQARQLIETVEAQGFSLVAERPVVKVTFLRDLQ